MNEMIRQHLVDCGLEQFLPQFETLPLLSIRIAASRVDQDETEVGNSRLGGEPDLPVDMAWPTWGGVDLPFLAQINLSDVAALDPTCILPKEGVLQFFYDFDYGADGSDPFHRGSAQVLYQSDPASLIRRPAQVTTISSDTHPARMQLDRRIATSGRIERKNIEIPSYTMAIPECYPCSQLRFRREWTLPDEDAPELAGLGWDWNERSVYSFDGMEQLYEPDWSDPWIAMHRLLGWPQPIQDDMRLECQLASNGVYCGPGVENDSRYAELSEGANQWRLLLQLADDEISEFDLGGARLYFFIRHDDLVNHRFGNIWGIKQYD